MAQLAEAEAEEACVMNEPKRGGTKVKLWLCRDDPRWGSSGVERPAMMMEARATSLG